MLLKDKIKIEKWLNKYNIKNYELIEDEEYGCVVNINGNVNLWNKELKSIDIKFNIVNGYFRCNKNKLTSLKGCPKIVIKDFDCGNNKLKSIDYSPEIVDCFDCYSNNITSLKTKPKIIKYGFSFYENNLTIVDLINLIDVESENNYINLGKNPKLGELQDINNFNELKKILNIYKEKNKLDLLLNKNIANNSLKSSDFIRKVEKI